MAGLSITTQECRSTFKTFDYYDDEKRGRKRNSQFNELCELRTHNGKRRKCYSREKVAIDELSHTHKKHAISLLYEHSVSASARVCACTHCGCLLKLK